jgi:hypothetical protein
MFWTHFFKESNLFSADYLASVWQKMGIQVTVTSKKGEPELVSTFPRTHVQAYIVSRVSCAVLSEFIGSLTLF